MIFIFLSQPSWILLLDSPFAGAKGNGKFPNHFVEKMVNDMNGMCKISPFHQFPSDFNCPQLKLWKGNCVIVIFISIFITEFGLFRIIFLETAISKSEEMCSQGY